MTQENLELILDLYKEDKIDRDSAISLIEDLANNKTQWYWTTPNPIISTYKDAVPASVPYTTFSTNKAELNFKQYGDN